MFESIGRRHPTPPLRRLGALIITLSQCSLATGALLALDGRAPVSIMPMDEPVLVELFSGGGGGGLPLPKVPALLPKAKPSEQVVPEVVPQVVPEPTSVAQTQVPDMTPSTTASPGVPGGGGLGTGGPSTSGPGTGGTGPGDGPPCPAGQPCGTDDSPVSVGRLEVRRRVMPTFPAAARSAGLDDATCVLQLTVDTRGRVEDVGVSGCHGAFHQTSVSAARRWRFEPLRVDGEPQRATFALTIHYRADG